MNSQTEPKAESRPGTGYPAAGCCGTEEKKVCCAAEEKTACCGEEPRPTGKTGCGCR